MTLLSRYHHLAQLADLSLQQVSPILSDSRHQGSISHIADFQPCLIIFRYLEASIYIRHGQRPTLCRIRYRGSHNGFPRFRIYHDTLHNLLSIRQLECK